MCVYILKANGDSITKRSDGIMSQNRKKTNYGYYVALFAGIAAFALLAGVYASRQSASEERQYVNLDEESDTVASSSGEQEATQTGADVANATNSDVADADSTDTQRIGKADLAMADTATTEDKDGAKADRARSEDTSSDDAGDATSESAKQDADSEEDDTQNQATSAAVSGAFAASSKLAWPVQGTVLLPYSMDTTIYFETIDVYKCNNGMVIQSEVGTPVYAAYGGTVLDVSESGEYGQMVRVDIGGGYTAIYGQLADVSVAQGDELGQGSAIGCIANPTAMYTKEGANLYFALQKDGEYVNPAEYLQ
jgi:septal ring factor EnvC (AmiA/AmiB activator)